MIIIEELEDVAEQVRHLLPPRPLTLASNGSAVAGSLDGTLLLDDEAQELWSRFFASNETINALGLRLEMPQAHIPRSSCTPNLSVNTPAQHRTPENESTHSTAYRRPHGIPTFREPVSASRSWRPCSSDLPSELVSSDCKALPNAPIEGPSSRKTGGIHTSATSPAHVLRPSKSRPSLTASTTFKSLFRPRRPLTPGSVPASPPTFSGTTDNSDARRLYSPEGTLGGLYYEKQRGRAPSRNLLGGFASRTTSGDGTQSSFLDM
ncbi:hypothetical protein B0H21DRAFT_744874 [Amylocystis lapponica]|nr:hypothetical protein B0H21DRAFT_744874 [Amylocystis lapponica]